MRRWLVIGVALAVCAPALAQAQALGRLFTTPDQRAELDQIRNDPDYGRVIEPEPEAKDEGPVVPHVTINGLVLRSSGLNASWVNGMSVPEGGATPEGIRIETSRSSRGGSVRLSMPGGLESIQLRPGQKIDILTGGVFEPYEYRPEEDAARVFEEQAAEGEQAEGARAPESSGQPEG